MRTYRRLVIAVLVASTALAALVSSASARNLQVSNLDTTKGWNSLEFGGGGATIRCGVTFVGRFHSRTIPKVVGSLIGYITGVTFRRPCTGGTAWAYNGVERNEVLGNTTFPNSLPWHITYEGFRGTLPRIEEIRTLLEGVRFNIRATVFGITLLCDYTTGVRNGGNATTTLVREAGGAIVSSAASGTIRSSTGGFCPTVNLSGNGAFSLTVGGARITVTLI